MTETPRTGLRRRLSSLPHQRRNILIIWTVLVVLFLFASLASPYFLRPVNLRNIVEQSGALALVAIGQTFVLLTGGIDLSVGSTIGLVVILAANLMEGPVHSTSLAIVACLAAGALVGLVNGVLVTRVRLLPFIVTLATLSIVRGATFLIRQAPPMLIPAEFSRLLLVNVGPFPLPLLLVAVVTVGAALFLRHTRLGRHIYAIGSNELATRLSGMNTDRVKTAAYVLSGLLAGAAGLYVAARTRSFDPLIGDPYLFDSITAAVVGGVSLFGGRGSVFGTLAAVLVLGMSSNLLHLWAGPSVLQYFVEGLLLVAAVVLYYEKT